MSRGWQFVALVVLIAAVALRRRWLDQAVGLVLVALGVSMAAWGVPHLRDPLEVRQRHPSEYEEPQQPGLFAIGMGGLSVCLGVVIFRGWFMPPPRR